MSWPWLPWAQKSLGDGGEQLHQWAFGDDRRDREIPTGGASSLGAVICGRRTYDDSIPWWGADGPTGPARVPLFVLSHDVPTDTPAGGVYSFVTEGIEHALEPARDAAGDKDVTVMGGADVGQQYRRAVLVDELSIHLAPVLFGKGTRNVRAPGQRACAAREPLVGPDSGSHPPPLSGRQVGRCRCRGETPAITMPAFGRVAQLARARRLQRRGHRFKPCHAHQPNQQVTVCTAVVSLSLPALSCPPGPSLVRQGLPAGVPGRAHAGRPGGPGAPDRHPDTGGHSGPG
jgi:dihydrofolate reductase